MDEHEDPNTEEFLTTGPGGPLPTKVAVPLVREKVGVREEAVEAPATITETTGVPVPPPGRVPVPVPPPPQRTGIGPFRTIEDFGEDLQEGTAQLIEAQGAAITEVFRPTPRDLTFLHRNAKLVSVREQNRQRGEALAIQVSEQIAEAAVVGTIMAEQPLWPYPLFALPILHEIMKLRDLRARVLKGGPDPVYKNPFVTRPGGPVAKSAFDPVTKGIVPGMRPKPSGFAGGGLHTRSAADLILNQIDVNKKFIGPDL